jgi:hypothetical protein
VGFIVDSLREGFPDASLTTRLKRREQPSQFPERFHGNHRLSY